MTRYRKNELNTCFQQKFETGSYRVGIGHAWCSWKACEICSSFVQKKELKNNNFSSYKLPKQQTTSFWSQAILGVKYSSLAIRSKLRINDRRNLFHAIGLSKTELETYCTCSSSLWCMHNPWMKSKIYKLHLIITHPYNVSFTCVISLWNPTSKVYNFFQMTTWKKDNSKSQHSKWTHSIHLLKEKQGPSCCRPLKEHSENLKHILIRVTLHAQSIDEVLNVQTSSIHTSFIKCPNEECQSILESHFWAL
jgi:hypothetical protein